VHKEPFIFAKNDLFVTYNYQIWLFIW